MKKFSKIIICLLLCVFAFGVVGCKKNNVDNNFHPASEDVVTGNGGLVVRKGEYVYFANGFQKVSDLTSDKQNASFVKGGLYAAKLTHDDFARDDDGLVTSDSMRVVSSKLAGYDATNLFVFGDYLYFVSPSNEKESGKLSSSEWAKDRSVFYRAKLNNFDDVQEIYQANVKHENLSFQYYYKDGKPYLLVHEKGEDLNGDGNKDMLKRIDVTAKKNKVSVVASNVSSIVFGYDSEDNAYDRVHYVEQKDGKYNLVRYNVAENSGTTIEQNSTETVVKFVGDKYVYVTKKDGDNTYMYRAEIGKTAFAKMFNADSSIVGDLYLLPEGEDVVAVRDNVIQFFLRGNRMPSINTIVDSDATKINVIGFANGMIVYYDNNNKLKTVNYADASIGGNYKINSLAKIEFNKDFIDIDGNNLYYFSGENNGYLFTIDLSLVPEEEATEGKMVGVYLDADKPKKDEE